MSKTLKNTNSSNADTETPKKPIFDVFIDDSYLDMWGVRLSKDRDFNKTLHFVSKAQADHAVAVITEWLNG